MKIGIDIDGVISDFVSTFREIVKEKYDVEFGEEDIREHDLYKILGVSEAEAISLIRETIDRGVKPQIGAIDAIAKLAEKHEIIIVTARPKDKETITKNWLKENNIKYHKFINVSTEGDKHKAGQEENFDVIIDDHLKEVIRWIDKVPLVLVYNHPWNKSLNIKNNFERVYSWQGILERLSN